MRLAQKAGLVASIWAPEELVKLVSAVATYWATATGPDMATLPSGGRRGRAATC
ncbi:hypothetical protein [Streptomyces adelaidensis]|uniref:hypothetical protein n=1 Tax=Streptomyces adelaidensis TaxID=2796465 RepID=UPI0027DAFDC5|nr:hypothetical protein [Streptomyces adelaidensis]